MLNLYILVRFKALGVIEETEVYQMQEIDSFFEELNAILQRPQTEKAEIVRVMKRFIPNFEHEEKGKNLDQKM